MPTGPAPASPIYKLADAIKKVADAITPGDAYGGVDTEGTDVFSLTEAVMGVTSGLTSIASAINRLAEAVERR